MLATVGDKGLKVPSVANDDRLLRTKLKTVVSELRSGGWSASWPFPWASVMATWLMRPNSHRCAAQEYYWQVRYALRPDWTVYWPNAAMQNNVTQQVCCANVRNFESNRIVTSVFDSFRNEHSYSKYTRSSREWCLSKKCVCVQCCC